MIGYLKNRKYAVPRPEVHHDTEAGVLDISWHTADGAWAILEIGENPDSDFSFCAKGPGGSIKMQGAATAKNLDVVIDFATALMKG